MMNWLAKLQNFLTVALTFPSPAGYLLFLQQIKFLMKISFSKYHGAGNDFILIDNRKEILVLDADQIAGLCDRHFGIGADGLILLQESNNYDFSMRYFNSDGNEASLCGNGGRCIVSFARHLGIIEKETAFWAVDGKHEAIVKSSNDNVDIIDLKMNDVNEWELSGNDYIFDTGSPHFVRIINNVDDIDMIAVGRQIRYSDRFKDEGINVNFISLKNGLIKIRTYERGVENETLACGTGAVASALAASFYQIKSPVKVKAKGGELEVSFNFYKNKFTDIRLEGPVAFVFNGEINI
jgi:diaminopimelate epimerase